MRMRAGGGGFVVLGFLCGRRVVPTAFFVACSAHYVPQQALKKLKAEMKQMEIRIGVVGHTLMQSKMNSRASERDRDDDHHDRQGDDMMMMSGGDY